MKKAISWITVMSILLCISIIANSGGAGFGNFTVAKAESSIKNIMRDTENVQYQSAETSDILDDNSSEDLPPPSHHKSQMLL